MTRPKRIVVEWMPRWLRASHESAGNSGSYPMNGAERYAVSRELADELLADAPDWATVVNDRWQEYEVLYEIPD